MPKNDGPILERKYSIWKAFPYSFFSKDLYADIGKNWRGTGYRYLFLTLALVVSCRALVFQEYAAENFPGFIASVPEFKVEKGVFSSSVSQPYVRNYASTLFALDTTGKIAQLAQVPGVEKADTCLLITQTQFMTRRVRLGHVDDKTESLAKIPSFNFDKDKKQRLSDFFVRWSGTFFFLFFLFLGFPVYGIVLSIYGLLGVLISEIRGKGLDYIVVLRLAIISHIPPFLLTTLMVICGLQLPMPIVWSFFLSMGFLHFAISAQEPVDIQAA